MNVDYSYLTGINPPWIHVEELTDLDGSTIPSYHYCQDDGSCVLRVIRGRAVLNTAQLMNEFLVAFQFAISRFGANWYALKDCLTCLDEWLPATRYIVYITDADYALSEQPEEWKWFLLTLHEVGSAWSKAITDNGRFNREPVPFHVLLKYEYGNLHKVLNSVREATDQFPEIQVSGTI